MKLFIFGQGGKAEKQPPNPSDICCGLDECLTIAHVVRFGLQHMALMRAGETFEQWVTESWGCALIRDPGLTFFLFVSHLTRWAFSLTHASAMICCSPLFQNNDAFDGRTSKTMGQNNPCLLVSWWSWGFNTITSWLIQHSPWLLSKEYLPFIRGTE